MPASGLAAGTEVSHYRIEELIARGGMGVVYRAVDVGLDRSVALKVLTDELSEDRSFRERFVRESRLAAAVDHPHVIPVYEAGDWEGTLYLAMRFVRGVDLHTVLARPRSPSTRRTRPAWCTATSSRATSCCPGPPRSTFRRLSTCTSPTSG
jgi:serine/threonine protein kinase